MPRDGSYEMIRHSDWLIPMIYTVISIIAGFALPRIEQACFPGYSHTMSVSSALAFFSSIGSGIMALTGIVFAIAFVVVQFSSIAYSPRLVIMFANSRTQFHALGIFFATFIYSLVALSWTDREGSGIVPFFSTMLVIALLIVSMVAFARLIQSLNHLEIHNVLRVIGGKGPRSHPRYVPTEDGKRTCTSARGCSVPDTRTTYSGGHLFR